MQMINNNDTLTRGIACSLIAGMLNTSHTLIIQPDIRQRRIHT